jgi:MtrB/PioB family decaheme-associated outer membrane protein
VGFDSQLQVRNDSGSSPFRGSDNNQRLPDDWVSGSKTSDWSALGSSLQGFDRELERERLSLGLDAKLNDNWTLETALSYEDKQGTADVGGAIYVDAASGDSVLLPMPVDYRTTEFDLGLLYSGKQLHLEGRLAYSDFDNKDEQLAWQNPYSSFGPSVAYSSGDGALGLAPDNEQTRARLTGQYILSSTSRIQFDGSYAIATQDQDYLDYTVNPALSITDPLPRNDYDGEVAISTFNGALLLRPVPKLNVKAYYKLRERDYDTPRDGYRYVRGDGGDQPRSALTVYNTAQGYLSRTVGMELAYRLPLRSRLKFEVESESVERENSAVEETKEDRFTLAYRIQPGSNFTARAELLYGNRRADTYQWDQSYYALLDVELINATPDKQRYINHPELSQYHLSNRDQLEGKLDFTYLPTDRWNLNLNLLWRDDDYDKSELGLTDSEWQRWHMSASYAASDSLSASVYGGIDRYESGQTSRAFRGGQEKNAFEIYPPLPQASDPSRDWDLDATDTALTLGANLQWQVAQDLALALDYSFVDTEGEQDFKTYGASDLDATDMPAVNTQLHHVVASGIWQMREHLSLKLDYQYYRYSSDDWAWQGVQADTIGKVLTFGERNPNEQIHYVGASVIYRWQ